VALQQTRAFATQRVADVAADRPASDGDGYWAAYRRLFLPDGDPDRLADAASIWRIPASPDSGVTLQGAQKLDGLRRALADPQSAPTELAKKQLFDAVHDQLVHPVEGYADPAGEERFRQWLSFAESAYDAGIDAGKSPEQLLAASGPDSIAATAALYQRPPGEWLADRVAAAEAADSAGSGQQGEAASLVQLAAALESAAARPAMQDRYAGAGSPTVQPAGGQYNVRNMLAWQQLLSKLLPKLFGPLERGPQVIPKGGVPQAKPSGPGGVAEPPPSNVGAGGKSMPQEEPAVPGALPEETTPPSAVKTPPAEGAEPLGTDAPVRPSGQVTPSLELDPNRIRFSQKTVSGRKEREDESYTYDDIVRTMETTKRWPGDPVDVVKMPDGELTSIDNTRLRAARETGIKVQANVHAFDEPLPADMIEKNRFGSANTWGEAVTGRINRQGSNFRSDNPQGTHELPRVTEPNR
jgi:hypothetical protein